MDLFSVKRINKINKGFLGKKTKIFEIKKTKKKEKAKIIKFITKDTLFETSTEQSLDNQINLGEKKDISFGVLNLDEIRIPSFLNDISKYNEINKKIKKYYKIKKELKSSDDVKLYLIDIKKLFEERKKL